MTKIENLLLSGKTIFNLQDLAVIWNIVEHGKLVELVKYYLRKKRILPIKKGLYSIKENYSDLELAQKLVPDCYISYHTSLSFYGVNFQFYSEIHCCSLKSRTIMVGEKKFVYHKIPDDIFYNGLGLVQESNFTISSLERTICDSLLINKYIGFDHLDNIDEKKLTEISSIYNNNRLEKSIKKLIKNQIKNYDR